MCSLLMCQANLNLNILLYELLYRSFPCHWKVLNLEISIILIRFNNYELGSNFMGMLNIIFFPIFKKFLFKVAVFFELVVNKYYCNTVGIRIAILYPASF